MNGIPVSKSMLSVAVSAAIGGLPVLAAANPVVKLKIEDVGSTVGGVYSSTLDGRSGGFRIGLGIDPETYLGASVWSGSAGSGEMLWEGAANPTGSFSTGFLLSGTPFVPYTFGSGAVGDIEPSGATPDLTVIELDFGGVFGGAVNFNLPPDPGSLQVNWVIPNGDDSYKVSFQWSHLITTAEDPTLHYVGFNTHWILEGTATTADSGLPGIHVDINVPGGTVQECSVTNGAFLSLEADVSLLNGAQLGMVSWSIDGEPAGTGTTLEPFVTLGEHVIVATAETTTGEVSMSSVDLVISDTTAPELEVAFVDARTGEPVTTIERRHVQRVIARMQASDVCDPDPVTEGTGGFNVDDGDVLKIRGGNNAVTLMTNSLLLRATATDASGNSVDGEQTLTITP